MLENFEPYTEDVTAEEKQLALKFANKISQHVGKHRAVKSKVIEEFYKIPGTKVRKMANYLRNTGKCARLVSTGQGYFVAANEDELISHLRSMYDRGSKITGTALNQAKHAGIDTSKITIKPVK